MVRNGIVLLSCVVALTLVNLSIADKEQLLAEGRVVHLELAPVDPRSLMQGDYMALHFDVANDAQRFLPAASENRDGTMVVALDANSLATFQRLDDGRPLAANEARLQYRIREGQLRFATDAFFFEEGSGDRYSTARYGEFRVADGGQLLLTGLRGRNLERLGP